MRSLVFPLHRAVLVFLLLLAACGPGAREKTISTTFHSVDAAATAFADYSDRHQQELIAAAKTKEEATAAVSEWRDKRSFVDKALIAAFRAIAIAQMSNDDQSLTTAIEAGVLVEKTLKDLGVTK